MSAPGSEMRPTGLLHSYKTVGVIMDDSDTNDKDQHSKTGDVTVFIPHILSFFLKTWCLRYPQSTECHHCRQSIRLHAASSGATEGFNYFFSVVIPKTKHIHTLKIILYTLLIETVLLLVTPCSTFKVL